jgi:hypothetical protein
MGLGSGGGTGGVRKTENIAIDNRRYKFPCQATPCAGATGINELVLSVFVYTECNL